MNVSIYLSIYISSAICLALHGWLQPDLHAKCS